MDQSDLGFTEVALIKGSNPKTNVLDGIETLGGINNFINNGDQVFIKFNLILPYGFPTNTNFDTLQALIHSCNKAGAKKVYVGGIPFKGFTIKAISNILGLKKYFESIGAELLFIDNSDYFSQKSLKRNRLKLIKKNSFSKVSVNNKEYLIPKVIINSDKFISVNQVNVHPLFKVRLSILNCFTIIPNNYQEITKNMREGKNLLLHNTYKQDLVEKIIDIYSIKKPDLVINDLFYVLEGAGPYIYKDSNLKKNSLTVLGSDALAVDIITTKIMNLDENNLLLEARKRKIGFTDISKIKVIGEKLEDIKINIDECVTKLEDIKLRNFLINSGQICSGCFEKAYHLLNIMKTHMIKDLKYISPKNSFLIGENPQEPENLDNNIILFGDCAINSTKGLRFRKKVKETKKKSKIKTNKRVLEIPGCPPDIFNSLDLLLNFYKKKNAPTLNLVEKISSYYFPKKSSEVLKLWEVL